MSCPSCGYLLQKLSVTTTSGGRFDIDHCGRCGGTWFDPYEINRIPYHEVVRIAHLTVLPKSPPPTLSNHKCPRCHKELYLFKSESLPKGRRLLRCRKCHGLFATQKALEEFKTHQEEKVKEYQTAGLAFPSLSVVFVPTLFVFLLFVVTFVTVFKIQETKEGRIKAQEMIENLQILSFAKNQALISFQTKSAVKTRVSLGTSTLTMTKIIVSKSPSTKHKVILEDLKPETVYFYRISWEDEKGRSLEGEMSTFTTGIH